MHTPTRLAAALTLIALLTIGTVLLLQTAPEQTGASGTFTVSILAPDSTLYNGTITAQNATAYSVLVAATTEAGLRLDVHENPAYQPCGIYVRAIGGFAEGDQNGGGWEYWIYRNGAWLPRAAVGACAFPLQDGDHVQWKFRTN